MLESRGAGLCVRTHWAAIWAEVAFAFVYIPLILRDGWLSKSPTIMESNISHGQASHLKSAPTPNCSKDTVLAVEIRYLPPPALYPIPRPCVLIRIGPTFTVYGNVVMLASPIYALFFNAWQISGRQILLQMVPATAGPTPFI